MSGYCVEGKHWLCADTARDSGVCSCPCHLEVTSLDTLREARDRSTDPFLKQFFQNIIDRRTYGAQS